MKTRTSLLFSSVLLACCFLAFGCSKKSTGPSGDGDGTTPEKTATIGPEGGELAVEDFILSVPPGAFGENCTLRLSADSDDETFGEARATRVFLIEDFPEDFSKSLRLAIRGNRALSGETYVAQADSVFDPANESMVGIYRYLPATDSSGILVCTLTPAGGEAPAFRTAFRRPSASLKKRTLEVLGIDGQESRTTARFNVLRNAKDPYIGPLGQAVNDMLERNWEIILEETGLDFTEKWPSFPISVILAPFPPGYSERNNPAVFCWAGIDTWYMTIDQKFYTSSQASLIGTLSGIQMLPYSMMNPEVLEDNMGEDSNSADRWLHLAVIHWAEELFSTDPNYRRPSLFPGHEMDPFRGMVKGATFLNTHHDRGMAAVIKFLRRQEYFSRADLYNTYQAINGIGRSEPQDPTDALLSNVQELITVWWPDFFKSYISGGVYGVAPSVFLDPFNLSGTWTIDPDGATEKVFSSSDSRVGEFPDLSAKLFLVDAGDPDMPEDASLSIDVDGEVTDQGLSALVFAVQPDRLEFLGGGPATSSNPEIPNLKANAESGVTRYLICVVNSTSHDGYLGSSELDLKLKIVQPDETPVFDGCAFDFRLQGDIHRWTTRGVDTTYTASVTGGTGNTMPGRFEENVFEEERTKSEDVTGGTRTETERLHVTLNPDLQSIASLEWWKWVTVITSYTTQEEHHFAAENIPINPSASGFDHTYEILGANTASAVTVCDRTNHYIYSDFEGFNTVDRFFSVSDSRLVVHLERERTSE